MTRWTILSIALCGLAGLPASAAEADMLVIPGTRVGVISADTSEADLALMLPEGQVKRVLAPIGEGYYACVTQVYVGTDHMVSVDWGKASEQYETDAPENQAECLARRGMVTPSVVTIEMPSVGWRTASGIGLGVTISELAEIVGAPVSLSVCPCDVAGEVYAEEGGIPHALRLWAYFPQDTDAILDPVVDSNDNYALSSTDIPQGMAAGFTISRMDVEFDVSP